MESVNGNEVPELTVREIFAKLLGKETVTLELTSKEAEQLLAHLNVVKCREKRLYEDLQMDFDRVIIRSSSPLGMLIPVKVKTPEELGMLSTPPLPHKFWAEVPAKKRTYRIVNIEPNKTSEECQQPKVPPQ